MERGIFAEQEKLKVSFTFPDYQLGTETSEVILKIGRRTSTFILVGNWRRKLNTYDALPSTPGLY